jgi:hypothetical protein
MRAGIASADPVVGINKYLDLSIWYLAGQSKRGDTEKFYTLDFL